jgi:hypothetical protein
MNHEHPSSASSASSFSRTPIIDQSDKSLCSPAGNSEFLLEWIGEVKVEERATYNHASESAKVVRTISLH